MLEVPIPAGQLKTDVHPSILGVERAQRVVNCNRDKMDFRIDRRYRQAHPTPSNALSYELAPDTVDATTAEGADWDDFANLQLEDGNTTVQLDSASDAILIAQYAPAVPSDCTIAGFEVRVKAKTATAPGGLEGILKVDVTKDLISAPSMSIHSKETDPLTETLADQTLGTSSDLWGRSFTAAQVNNGIRVYVQRVLPADYTGNLEIDYLELIIHVLLPDDEPQAIQIGLTRNAKEIVAIHGGALRAVLASDVVDSTDGSVSAWDDDILNNTGLGTARYRSWQHKNWIFFTDPDGNVKYMEIGQRVLQTLYRNYTLDTGGIISTELPPYTVREFTGDSAAVVPGSPDGGDMSISNGGVVLYDGWNPNTYHITTHEIEITFAASVDLSRHDYIGCTIGTTNGNYISWPIPTVQLLNAARPDPRSGWPTSVKWQLKNSDTGASLWIDLSEIDRTERAAITGLYMSISLNRDGPDGFIVSPLRLGGVFLNSYNATKIDTEQASKAKEIQYAYSYIKSDGTEESPATIVALPGYDSLGTRMDGDIPYMGIHSKLTFSVNGDPPYDGTSKIRVYRKVESSWYRIDDNSILNTGTPTWTDKRTADEVKLLTLSTPTFGDLDPSASGAVTNIECGCGWAGSNVYFGSNGRVYFSQVGNFRNVLWDEITIDNSPDEDLGRPRTLDADPIFGEPVIAAVSQDALYMFTRHRGFAITGDLPVLASWPRILPGVRGVVGPRAACAWAGGALVAADDGLWLIEVPSAFAGAEYPKTDDLTTEVFAEYLEVLGDSPETVIVVADEEECWVLNEYRYLHLTKNGNWVYGEWAEETTVIDACSSPEHGIILLMGDGNIGHIGDFLTDGGTAADGSNGTPADWTYRTGRYMREGAAIGVKAAIDYNGRPDCLATVSTERHPEGASVAIVEPTNRTCFRRPLPADVPLNGGWVELELRGSPFDVMYDVRLELNPMEANRHGV